MRYYFFSIKNNTIDKIQKTRLGNASQYTLHEKNIGFEEIHYKTSNGEIVTVMCEADSHELAIRAVKLFLSGLKGNM
jgi:hypothetical protein